VVECLLRKHKALSSNPTTAKKKKEEGRGKRGEERRGEGREREGEGENLREPSSPEAVLQRETGIILHLGSLLALIRRISCEW
jgi:hypothetical protein